MEVEGGNRMVPCPLTCRDRYDKITTMAHKQVDVHTHHDCTEVMAFFDMAEQHLLTK